MVHRLTDKEHPIIQALKGDRRVVINRCHGGFGLSDQAIGRYLEIRGQQAWPETEEKYGHDLTTWWLVPPEQREPEPTAAEWEDMDLIQRQQHNHAYRQHVFRDRDIARDDPVLVRVVEELGAAANGRHACLKIVEIPWHIDWQIEEYDGREWIAESHRTWR